MKEIKDIAKNRFLVWLMWVIPIACTGWISIIIWTIVQVWIYNSEIERLKEFKKPIRERGNIKEMNKEQNLTKEENLMLKTNPNLVKVEEGVFIYEDK